jgi:hypothetical protein
MWELTDNYKGGGESTFNYTHVKVTCTRLVGVHGNDWWRYLEQVQVEVHVNYRSVFLVQEWNSWYNYRWVYTVTYWRVYLVKVRRVFT